MKKIIPSLLLSLFSFPIADLMRYIFFHILPPYGDSGIALISCVIGVNFISLITAIAVINKKEAGGKQ